ncbi:MAG: DnaJ C-terminal domain-containing protein [bacterium]
MADRSYYEVLGVNENANFDEIKKAYRKLAKENHPDKHRGDKAAEDRFKEISEAYSVLSDSKKRQQYDQMRKYGFGDFSGSGFRSGAVNIDLSDIFGSATGGRKRSTKGRADFNLDDLFGFGGLGDLFSQIFENERGRRAAEDPGRRENDIRVNLEIPFEKAVRGGEAVFSVHKDLICQSCSGSGSASSKGPSPCPDCNGSGTVAMAKGAFAVKRPCPRCLGRGQIVSEPCAQCNGTGKVKGTKKYSMKIKPATEDGQTFKLRGQGNPGFPGDPAGDLIVTVRVRKHRFFSKRGLDIFCEVPLNKKKAEKGTQVKIRTIHGNSVKLTIPPNSENGKTFLLKGLGVKSNGSQGDQYVKIKVE